MKKYQLSGQKHNAIIRMSLSFIFLLTALTIKSQTPTNFSGRWEYDKAASDKGETGESSFKGTIVLEISQNSSIITFTNIYIRPGMDDYKIPADTLYLDGRVVSDNSGTGPAKKSLKWSQDKKILTTSSIMTDKVDGVAQDFLTANTYKLSADGKTLTVEEFNKSKLNGEHKVRKVYKKKVK